MSIGDIPIYINNFECLRWPQAMVAWLLAAGYHNIHIVDNASTYPPLIEWYGRLPKHVRLHRLKKNIGKRAPWIAGCVKHFTDPHRHYVVTDPDLDLSRVPHDVITFLRDSLHRHPHATKIGLGLEIRDLPAAAIGRAEVLRWEQQYWKKRVVKDKRFFHAPVDTTFALHRFKGRDSISACKSDLRADYPYVVRHLPWYLTDDDITDEDAYRYGRTRNGYWGRALGKYLDDDEGKYAVTLPGDKPAKPAAGKPKPKHKPPAPPAKHVAAKVVRKPNQRPRRGWSNVT